MIKLKIHEDPPVGLQRQFAYKPILLVNRDGTAEILDGTQVDVKEVADCNTKFLKDFTIPVKIRQVDNKIHCPGCGVICESTGAPSMVWRSEPEFIIEPDPHYSWDEIHQCTHCETLFILQNGT